VGVLERSEDTPGESVAGRLASGADKKGEVALELLFGQGLVGVPAEGQGARPQSLGHQQVLLLGEDPQTAAVDG
jgi:hypothetical protein